MNVELAKSPYIKEFRSALNDGIEGLTKAAKIYVTAIDEDKRFVDVFRDEFAEFLPAQSWAGVEAVGRKWMHPRLLMGGGGRYAAKIKKLPYTTQEKIFSGDRFEMLTPDGSTMRVDLREVAPEQIDQLIDGNSIRTLSAQKAYLESRKSMPAEPVEMLPYTISGDRVTFRRSCTLTRAEIKRLLAEM